VLVEGDALKVWFPMRAGLLRRVKGYVKAVDGVSLKLRAGTTLGVVGESGSGKTTLGLAVLRLVEAEGRIRFAGREISSERQRRLRPLAPRDADRLSRTPIRACRRGCRSRRSSARGCGPPSRA
jgi:microcin C transport system ATP-binding protein